MDPAATLFAFIGYVLLFIFAAILLYSLLAIILSILWVFFLPFLWVGSAADIIEGKESDGFTDILGKGFFMHFCCISVSLTELQILRKNPGPGPDAFSRFSQLSWHSCSHKCEKYAFVSTE